MNQKIEKFLLESTIILSIIGIITGIYFKLFKSEADSSFVTEINTKYPIGSKIVYLIICTGLSLSVFRDIQKEKTKENPSLRNYYWFVLFTFVALVMLYDLVEILTT